MDFSTVVAAMGAINSALDLGKSALATRDAMLDAQQRLFELSAALNTLQHENFQATQELRELRETLAERNRYALVEVGDGQFAYGVNTTPALGGSGNPGPSEPEHYLCQQCFDGPAKAKVVLQRRHLMGAISHLACPVCSTTLSDDKRCNG